MEELTQPIITSTVSTYEFRGKRHEKGDVYSLSDSGSEEALYYNQIQNIILYHSTVTIMTLVHDRSLNTAPLPHVAYIKSNVHFHGQ